MMITNLRQGAKQSVRTKKTKNTKPSLEHSSPGTNLNQKNYSDFEIFLTIKFFEMRRAKSLTLAVYKSGPALKTTCLRLDTGFFVVSRFEKWADDLRSNVSLENVSAE